MVDSHLPSTAAITTLSIAVSVAVVILCNVRIEAIREKRYRLYVDFPLFCVGFLGQSSKPTLEVVAASPGITRLTLIILPRNGQLIPEYSKEGYTRLTGKKFLIGE